MIIKRYSELIQLETFRERFEYLVTANSVGKSTFGSERWLNQVFYRSREWRKTRQQIIIRDDGFDLAHPDFPIYGHPHVHHINPITAEELEREDPILLNPENLILCSEITHKAITYGSYDLIRESSFVERQPNDTSPWLL